MSVLPTLMTLGNLICGFAAIHYASKSLDTTGVFGWPTLALAGALVFLGMFFDAIDGSVARLTRSTSDLGAQLDSLSDVVTFGVAPAFMMLRLVSQYVGPTATPDVTILSPDADTAWGRIVWGVAAVYICCTALRLARFNVANDVDASSHKRFRGLPSPGAAGCVAALAILRGEFAQTLASPWVGIDRDLARAYIERALEIVSPLCALVVALLMVSNVSYPHVTGKIFRGKKHIGHLIQVLLAAFILVMFRSLAPLLVFWIYAFIFPMRALVVKNLRTEPETPRMDEPRPQ